MSSQYFRPANARPGRKLDTLSNRPLSAEQKAPSKIGGPGGQCVRPLCTSAKEATFYHVYSGRYYCPDCAHDLNRRADNGGTPRPLIPTNP